MFVLGYMPFFSSYKIKIIYLSMIRQLADQKRALVKITYKQAIQGLFTPGTSP